MRARPLESPAVPTDDIEVDPVETVDEDHPVPPVPPGTDWETDLLDARDQLRQVPLDDDR